MEFEEAYRLVQPRDPRLKVSIVDEEINVEYITGDMQFYDNELCNARFQCNFEGYLAIGDAISSGADGSHDTMKVMKNIGDVTYLQPNDKKDLNGKLYRDLEAMLLTSFKFDGFFEPSLGTLWRLSRLCLPKCQKNGVFDKPELHLYFLRPGDYYLDVESRVKFLAKLAEFRHVAQSAGYQAITHKVTYDTIPTDKFLCFCSSGWRMHNFRQCNGIGLEFNPHVSVITGSGLLDVDEHEDVYNIRYVKNNWTHEMQYYKYPSYSRYHGSDFMRLQGSTGRFEHNLFNVVSTKMYSTFENVSLTPISVPAHCPMRVVVPKISGSMVVPYRGLQVKLAVDSAGNVVDVINPQLEVSSRTALLAEMGYFRPIYDDGNFSVLSTIRSVYVDFVRKECLDVSKTFVMQLLNFPSSWFFNGQHWYLRAYPEAARFRMCNDNTGLYFDDVGNSLIPCVIGQWYYSVDDFWVLVPKSDFYDERLVCSDYVDRLRSFYVSGLTTKLYSEFPHGEKFVIVEKVCRYKLDNCVTVRMSNKLGKTREVFETGLIVKCVEKCNNGKLFKTFYFETVGAATQFYTANKSLQRFICYGDIFKPMHFIDPTCREFMLIPKAVHCLDDFYYSFSLSLTNMFKTFKNYDAAGNFYGSDLYTDKFSFIDTDEFEIG